MPLKNLIIGRGLAGSILSLQFLERNIPHDIIDEPSLSGSSKIAAGLINPIVLKRLKMVQEADEFLPVARNFYLDREKTLEGNFFKEMPVHHVFNSIGEINLWNERSEKPLFQNYLGSIDLNSPAPIIAPHGIGILNNTGWLDTQTFLDSHQKYFQQYGKLIQKTVSIEALKELKSSYDTIFICNGHLLRFWYDQLQEAFAPTRGEILVIKTTTLPENVIFHGPVFILPLGNDYFKVGATYHWENFEDLPTEEGKNQLTTKLEKIFSGPYEVIDHLAGVRPNIKDRKPLLGHLEDNIYTLNGLGSRGALMAPLLSKMLADHIYGEKDIPPKFDVKRFL